MTNYIAKRLLMLVPVVFGVVTLVFFLIHLIPGDPVEIMLGEYARAADKEALRHELRLDRPLGEQYFGYLTGLIQGDLGKSIHSREPVIHTILQRFPATLLLTVAAMTVAILIAVPIGIVSATRQYSLLDNGSMLFALLGISMPNFWLGPLLILTFSIHLGWLPVSGMGGVQHLILPAITLGTALAAILTRMTRASVLEVIREQYIVTARAKGLRERVVLFKHALRNALTPVITILGLQFGALLSGSIITETIFSWPGIGRLVIQAVNQRDYPTIQGCVLFISLSYVLVNLATDLLYGVADPRIRIGEGSGDD
ncbi:MAG: ABC transporter permease [bacterium]|nr:ABC transporter permease [bacterium]